MLVVPSGEEWTVLNVRVYTGQRSLGFCSNNSDDVSVTTGGDSPLLFGVAYNVEPYVGSGRCAIDFNDETGQIVYPITNDLSITTSNDSGQISDWYYSVTYIEEPYASSTMEIINPSFNLFGGLVLFLLVAGFFINYFRRHG